ncbi:beta-ketoacyl-[acyl-carrier-protein] synthase family protein [Propionimicrobium sp. PCR01-08-3]|uniref:beta-ketoacyl-[acyl-carrier-protein] synthase family protein n=1 Tax=Propionimicrobium sp. PCR01-08-3 TaxID=3052086 RepID=UPI00255C3BF5|nr:beta-ketoacyl-[acyl-carrier-protein] synthase family protein [Propionimicrobium sp. PCR01-08-3]WIY82240.1 beta-ketoacyl-[acyl-carrier-protein] synthase family protein [Propionimicrobium sp. PCR01-08-3]
MRIAMTGHGAVTPLGANVDTLWSGLIEGRSAARELDELDASWADLPVRVAAPVTTDLETVLGRVRARQLDRSQQLALVAANEAWQQAGLRDIEPERLAVAVGTGIGGIQTLLGQDDTLESGGPRRVSPRTVPMLMPNGASAQISIEYAAKAGVFTPTSACASGAEAIAMGARLIQEGEADVVIAGGAEAAITPLTLAGFAQAQALAKPDGGPVDRLSRPFDTDRRGFVLGEGAGIVILESESHAAARGGHIHAWLSGWGITSDAHHITGTEPGGIGQVRAIRKALASGGLTPNDVGHVNAHATGTIIGDRAEAQALVEVFGDGVNVTAPKGALGHLVGGAGAVEAIITARTIESGIIPATANLQTIDPEIQLDVVKKTRRSPVRAAISNSFGFGGQNVTLVICAA